MLCAPFNPWFSRAVVSVLSLCVKAGTHWPNRWTSEAFGETRMRSGTNMFGVFSCTGSFRSWQTLSAPIQHAKSEEVGCRTESA